MTAQNTDYVKTFLRNTLAQSRREKNVAMVHSGRSGSTVLGHLFNQHPQIFWDSEIFMGNRMPAVAKPIRNLLFRAPKLVVSTRRQRTTKPIYGFEAKPSQIARVGLTLPQFVTMMNTMGFAHFILLRRRNHLRIIISDLVAKQKGIWHQNFEGTTEPNGTEREPNTVKLDVNAVALGSTHAIARKPLLAHLQIVEAEYQQLTTLLRDKPVLTLTYEDHIEQDPAVAYQRVCDFLAIPSTPVQVALRKTTPGPIEAIVENFAEVTNVLAGTPYEWMLYG